MRMFNRVLLLVTALMLLTMPALAETATASDLSGVPATLSVTGSAIVTLTADWAQVTLGVTTAAETVNAASAANTTTLDAILASVTALGVDAADVATDSFSVNPQYEYQHGKMGETQIITGYQVSNLLRVSVRDVAQVGSVLDAAMNAGANECYGVDFRASDGSAATDQAMQLAIAEGQRKASLMAAACGRTLGALISIEENGGSRTGIAVNMAADKASGTTILPDGLDFTASVTMVYALH